LISAGKFFLSQCCACSTGRFCSPALAFSAHRRLRVFGSPRTRWCAQCLKPEIAPENNAEPPAAPSQQQPATSAANPGQTLNTRPDQASFLRRLIKVYADDWKPLPAGPGTTSFSASAPALRGDSAPQLINGPPFPFSTWPIGGTVSIGQPWTQTGPLMTALWSGPRRHLEEERDSKLRLAECRGKLQPFESWNESVGGEVRQFPHGLR
jgi:hypothetical protein